MTGGQKGRAASNHHEVRVPPEVVDLLVDHDPQASDFTHKPWRLYHEDGRAFTARESALANTATLAEVMAARRLAQATDEHCQRQHADLQRMQELLGIAMKDGGEDLPVPVLLARLPPELQAEADTLFSRYSRDDLRG